MTGPGGDQDHDRVQPARFEPPGQASASASGLPVRPLALVVGAGLLIFAVAAWYLLTALSVQLRFEPAAESVSVSGGWSLPVGERRLMRPGNYQVQASRAGYEPFSQTITVKPGEDAVFDFKLQKLPGRLGVSSTPAGARVSVNEQPVGETPLRDHKLPPGEYDLTLRAERYEVWREKITIEGLDKALQVDAELVPAWAAIGFSSQPAGATVLIDGKPRGQTPLTTDVGAGDHEITYRLAGYQTRTQPLTVKADQPRELDTVTLQPALGRLKLTSRPAGASVTVDGQFQGSTPLTVSLKPGQDSLIKLTKAGYSAASRRFTLNADEQDSASFELEPVLGEIRVTATPADARLFVDGTDRGAASQTLRLTAVPHKLSIRKPGYVSHEVSVTPRPDTAQSLNIRLKSQAQAKAEAVPARVTAATGQSLVLIQPGRFTMGSPRREQGRQNNEVQQPVRLTRPFYLAVHEVTNAAFRQFKSGHSSGIVERTTLDNDNYPVVRVSWAEATAFCNWLSERDGLPAAYAGGQLVTPVNTGYRLPTEAEWAYAARFAGGRDLKYAWGQTMPPTGRAGNYADRASAALLSEHLDSYDDGFRAAAPVGRFAANALGIHDLGGNVSEWVNDSSGGVSLVPRAELTDPLGSDAGGEHRVRGASWRHGRITELRLAWRDSAGSGRDDLGFRIARYAEAEE